MLQISISTIKSSAAALIVHLKVLFVCLFIFLPEVGMLLIQQVTLYA